MIFYLIKYILVFLSNLIYHIIRQNEKIQIELIERDDRDI